MVRRIKKKYGYISLVLFICAIPITFYSLMFYDSAPYFTLCIFGCFSVENCTTNDKNWGKYTSLSYVFSLAFLLSAQALSIRFNLIFIKFTTFDVKKMVNEVNEKYSKDIKKRRNGEDDDDDDSEYEGKPNETRMNAISTKIDNKDDQIDMHSDKGKNSASYMDNKIEFSGFHRERFQNEFTNVAATFKPIKYRN